MASSAPPQPPPRITVYRNGDKHFAGKKFVVNRKYYRSFENFLDKVTTYTRSRVAIRKIHTPMGGTRVGSLEMIQNGAVYVAAGTERFRRVDYGGDPLKMSSSTSNVLQPATRSKINATSRYKQEAMAEPLRNRIIFVYRNGEVKTPPVKLLLDKRTLRSMDAVLQYLSSKVNMTSGSVKSIYSFETGVKITNITEINTNASYIAVGAGKHFHKGQVFNESLGKSMSQSPRDRSIDLSFKSPNKPKGAKKSDVLAVTSSLSLPDPGLTSGLIALSEEIEQNNDEELNVNGSSLLKAVEDAADQAVTSLSNEKDEVSSSLMQSVEETEVIVESSEEISGTPPETPNNETLSIDADVNHLPLGNSDEHIGESFENPTLSSSPVTERNDESSPDGVEAVSETLADTTLQESSENDNTSGLNDESNEDRVPPDESEPDVNEVDVTSDEMPSVYKASGLQMESGNRINDDQETTVEKTVDMMVAAEVEEDFEQEDEARDTNGS